MAKILTVVGARPQFIKAAVVLRAMSVRPDMQSVLVHTGQHYDRNMSEVFFAEMGIPEPDYNLGVGSGHHGAQTGRMLESLEQVMLSEKPDCVMVYGDTNSTLAAALAAVKLHVPVAHVEAGLRSFNRLMPEEINRVVTDHVSDLLFAPTSVAVSHLHREGIPEDRIHLVGDVMYDAAIFYSEKAEASSSILDDLGLVSRQYIVATVHRAENTDDPLRLQVILDALTAVSANVPVVWPVHPRARAVLKMLDIDSGQSSRIVMIEPVGYLDMVMLLRNAALVATDSGGVQKEAFFHRVPCVTMRTETEWVELVESGWNRLAYPENADVLSTVIRGAVGTQGEDIAPYGTGRAAHEIADIIGRSIPLAHD